MKRYLTQKRDLLRKPDLVEFPLYFPKIQFFGILLRRNNDIATVGKMRLVQPEVLANQSLDPVP